MLEYSEKRPSKIKSTENTRGYKAVTKKIEKKTSNEKYKGKRKPLPASDLFDDGKKWV